MYIYVCAKRIAWKLHLDSLETYNHHERLVSIIGLIDFTKGLNNQNGLPLEDEEPSSASH